jgi:ABC-type polysaccharide/polyol phosphate transport system ATPase subunit
LTRPTPSPDASAETEAHAPLAIDARGVSKRYKVQRSAYERLFGKLRGDDPVSTDFWALREVSLQIPVGQTLGILGVNGSGKSTLLQVIAGVLRPSSGQVAVRGRVAALLELGAGFNPEFTGRDNVYMNGAIMGIPHNVIDERIGSIAAFADIGEFFDQPVKFYSSGMFARLAFAVSIHVEPDILIVDEALSVGDVFFQQKCYDFMRRQFAGRTKILVTHDLTAVGLLSDRVIVMEGGRIAYDGDPVSAVKHYNRMVHRTRRLFAAEPAPELDRAAVQSESDGSPGLTFDHAASFEIPSDAVSGLGEVRIVRAAIRVDDSTALVATPGARVDVALLCECTKPATEPLIFGYLVFDKYAQRVFGHNSLSVDAPDVRWSAGTFVARFSFTWPEVLPGDYTLTLGVGEGWMKADHNVQCWANHAAVITCVTESMVHGVFNNPLSEFSAAPLRAPSPSDPNASRNAPAKPDAAAV